MKKYIGIIVIALSVAMSCDKKVNIEQKPAAAASLSNILELSTGQARNADIGIGNLREKELGGILQLQGVVTVSPQSRVDVTFPLGGYIRKTNIMPGTPVKKGQVLAVIEDMQYIQLQQDYLTAREKFLLADKAYDRQKVLNASKASSDKLLEQVRAERETQRIAMASLGQKLELLGIDPNRLNASGISKSISIVSPVTGLVSKVNVNAGKYVSSTEMLFEVIDMKDIVLSFNAFEKDMPYLKAGQQVEVYSNDNPDKRYAAKIAYVNQSLDDDRTSEVICKLENYDNALLPGLFVNADIQVENKKALVLPEEGVVDWKGKSYIFEAKGDDRYEMIPVETGIIQNGMKQIFSGHLSTSSKVVVKNAYTLLMKAMNKGEE
ncbi:efflux RND transporter periplasmic adaptor subunit [Sinomicrobium weinanense]|uniref:Efflux RND transporter periplasmic adaptor subunit n=1 Tax=Sinomicrobium weinanense TaxID=2842200 RepID=A0A926Q314_9FLAO|nr:efflux RND transporter periplasmic adaptor subunit [Sinomicrobium weinanense]MBC9797093.1 efflux RND transporter periplasmic adaptor subunit [Sinomicrobium weinanense]MBU3122678.1 efflux RND transporter periplasmic adaptor subunit [Sinomicrobium weinanense]